MKKTYQVIQRTQRNIDGVDGLKFGKSRGFFTQDAALAKDINDKYGMTKTGDGSVVVAEEDRVMFERAKNDGHPMRIHVPGHTWKSDGKPSGGKRWVEVGPGRYKLVASEDEDGKNHH